MCLECGRSPCMPQCPNHVDQVVAQCAKCKAGIVEFEDYFEVDEKPLCADCFDAYKDSCRRIGGIGHAI